MANKIATTSSRSDGAASTPAVSARITEVKPRVDIFENEDELLLLADVPGAVADSVNVRLDGLELSVQAERAVAVGTTLRYHRAFRMPMEIDPDGITAKLSDGVLQVQLKKSEAAKPKVIPIRS